MPDRDSPRGRALARLYADGDRLLAWVGVCDTVRTRARGLLGVREMATDECVLLTPCRSIHTKGMKMPIDVAFLDRDRRVLAVREDLAPGHFLLSRRLFRTRAVIEAAAGAFREWGLAVGDVLRLEDA